jgi:hypothetical protein
MELLLDRRQTRPMRADHISSAVTRSLGVAFTIGIAPRPDQDAGDGHVEPMGTECPSSRSKPRSKRRSLKISTSTENAGTGSDHDG